METYEKEMYKEGNARNRPRRLESDVLSYLKEVKIMLQEKEKENENVEENEDNESMEMFIWNILDEIAPRSASAVSDRHACEIMEYIITKLSCFQLRYLLQHFKTYHSHLWTNRYSSHVLQKIIFIISNMIHINEEKVIELSNLEKERIPLPPNLSTLILDMLEETESEWIEFITDISASHVLRSIVCLLKGIPIPSEKRGKNSKHRAAQFLIMNDHLNNKINNNIVYKYVPNSFYIAFNSIFNTLTNPKSMEDYIYDSHASPFFSILMKASASNKQSLDSQGKPLHELFIYKILKLNCPNLKISENAFSDYSKDPISSHFMEAIMTASSEEFLEMLYNRFLNGKLLKYAEHDVSNYVVQSIIINAKNPKMINEIISELQNCLWTLLINQRLGVIWHLTAKCSQLTVEKQKIFIEKLLQAIDKKQEKLPLHCKKSPVQSLLSLVICPDKQASVNFSGIQIVKNLLTFATSLLDPILDSLLEMTTAELVSLGKNSCGSLLLEFIWTANGNVFEITRKKLFNKLKGSFVSLAESRVGAFSVTKAFDMIPADLKIELINELLEGETKLNGMHIGQIVLKHCRIIEYKKDKNKWLQSFNKENKLKNMFNDIIQETIIDKKDTKDNDNTLKHQIEKKEKKNKKEKKHKK